MHRIGFALVLLLLLCVAACGGDEQATANGDLGDAVIASSAEEPGVDIGDGVEVAPGVVQGEPVLREGDDPPPTGVSEKRATCSGTTLKPAQVNLRDIRTATLCLLNAERGARGLAPLRSHPLLARAAVRHTRDMVTNRYFAHDSRDGTDFSKRIQRTGYLRASNAWAVGENLAWGSDVLATPAEIVDSWMNSPGHRANVLNSRYKEIGIAVTLGTPVPVDSAGATYATEFGLRLR